MKLTVHPFLAAHKRIIFIVGIGIAALAIGLYVVWSVTIWGGYVSSYEGWKKDARQVVDQALALPSTSREERVRKLEALKNISDRVEKATCDVHILLRWQDVFGNLKQHEVTCQKHVEALREFMAAAKKFSFYLENEQKLAMIVSAAIGTQEKLVDTSWAAQLAAWQKAMQDIDGLSAIAEFRPVKQAALQGVKGVSDSWQAVLAAHEAKDKAKYIQAQAQLAGAYATLSTLKTVSSQQFGQEVASLQKAYAAAF